MGLENECMFEKDLGITRREEKTCKGVMRKEKLAESYEPFLKKKSKQTLGLDLSIVSQRD